MPWTFTGAISGQPATGKLDGSANTQPLAFDGTHWQPFRIPAARKDLNGLDASTLAVLISPPDSTKRVRIFTGVLSVSAKCSVVLMDGDTPNVIWRSGILQPDTQYPVVIVDGGVAGSVGAPIKVLTPTGVTLTGTLPYSFEVPTP